MKSLTNNDGHAVVSQRLRRAAIRLVADDDEATPETAALGRDLEARRQALRAEVDAWEVLVVMVAIWAQRVKRRDAAVDKATAELVRALRAHADEAAVAAVLPVAVPSAASQATKGIADDTQRRFVRNLISQVKVAGGMPAKVQQRLAALEAAQAGLEAAVTDRQVAEEAERAGRLKLDQAVADARTHFNSLYFQVGALFPKDKARVEAYFA